MILPGGSSSGACGVAVEHVVHFGCHRPKFGAGFFGSSDQHGGLAQSCVQQLESDFEVARDQQPLSICGGQSLTKQSPGVARLDLANLVPPQGGGSVKETDLTD